nr:PREDICTED: succinate receptor 1 [Latimeria chalumnae]|eukprot:XP_005996538.1 PREDICTED: succinate receptor 1 [Latimeria chalumnae]
MGEGDAGSDAAKTSTEVTASNSTLTANETQEHCTEVNQVLEKYYLPTFYSLEALIGLSGNIIVILAYIFCLKNWKNSNIYLFNLSLSDLAFLCTLPILVTSYNEGKWLYGDLLCKVNRYLLHANLYTSMLFLTFISIDRYMLLSYPFRQNILQKKWSAVAICFAIWILVTFELLPIFFFLGKNPVDSNSTCIDYASSGDPKPNLIYSMFLTMTGFIIPQCIMCFFCYRIVLFLRNRDQQWSDITGTTFEKPLILVISAVVIFSVLFTPYHIMRNIRIASRLESIKVSKCTEIIIESMYIVTRPIAFLSSVVNPIFYFMMGDQFREILWMKVKTACCRI